MFLSVYKLITIQKYNSYFNFKNLLWFFFKVRYIYCKIKRKINKIKKITYEKNSKIN